MIEAPARTSITTTADSIDEQDAHRAIAEHVNSLLSQWHAWSAGHSVAHGYPTVNTTCRSARASRQYDDANGGLDAHIDHVLMEAVDGVIDAIADPWRSALSVQARNLHTGRQVWNSPRLPSCGMMRGQILMVARKKFVDGLARGGLV
jgi:hypothetical protein